MSAVHISTAAGLRRILVIHQNFPGQFRHVVAALQGRDDVELIGIGREGAPGHARHAVAALQNPPQRRKGNSPLLPQLARLIHLCEWFYDANGPDMGFDPEFPAALNDRLRVSTWRAHHLLALEQCDVAIAPTHWQKSQFPATSGCQVLIVGGDGVSYGRAPAKAKHWREALLRELSAAEGFDVGRVHFLGRLPSAQYRRVLQVSAVHLYLTYPFVLSWSLLEALASGCAVVASDTAPVREVIRDGENGLLVDFFDRVRLVEAVLELLADPVRRKGMRRAAVESVMGRYTQAAGTAGYLRLMACAEAAMTKAPDISHRVQEASES